MDTMKITCGGICLYFDRDSLAFSIEAGQQIWNWDQSYHPHIVLKDGEKIRQL